MYGGDEFLKVSRFDNGFSVEIKDPGIVKYNKARDQKNNARKSGQVYLDYKDPWRTFIFDTALKAQTFIAKNIAKAIVAAKTEDSSEYATAFDTAVSTTKSDKDGDE